MIFKILLYIPKKKYLVSMVQSENSELEHCWKFLNCSKHDMEHCSAFTLKHRATLLGVESNGK